MGWWITLGVLTLCAILPLGVRVCYDANGPLVKLVFGPVKIKVYPRIKRDKKSEKPKKEKESSGQRTEEKELPRPPQPVPVPKQKNQAFGGSFSDFIPFIRLGIDFLGDLRRKLRLNDLYLRLILASSDPCDLAVNYGKTWTAVGNLMPALERWFVIKKRDVEVECDFTASETKVIARLGITMTLGRLLALVAVYAVRALKEYIQFRNNKKGGAVK
jgi:hypothetical protein